MPVAAWMRRLTDESNLWFLAVKSEDAHRFADAANFYLREATECVKKNMLVHAALSCACAASCLEELGDVASADRLYSEAASIHLDNAIRVVGVSIQERLWSLERAHVFFLLAHEPQSAGEVRSKKMSLERGNLFIDFGGIIRNPQPNAFELTKTTEPNNSTDAVWISKSIVDFLSARRIQMERMRKLGA